MPLADKLPRQSPSQQTIRSGHKRKHYSFALTLLNPDFAYYAAPCAKLQEQGQPTALAHDVRLGK
jgi:hypothetical protein